MQHLAWSNFKGGNHDALLVDVENLVEERLEAAPATPVWCVPAAQLARPATYPLATGLVLLKLL